MLDAWQKKRELSRAPSPKTSMAVNRLTLTRRKTNKQDKSTHAALSFFFLFYSLLATVNSTNRRDVNSMAFDAQHMFSVLSRLCKCILCTEKKKMCLNGKLLAAADVVAGAVLFFLVNEPHAEELFADGHCQSCRQTSRDRLSIT